MEAGEPSSLGHCLTLTVLSSPFALCRLAAAEPVPEWTALARTFLTISRSATELSIVADEAAVPAQMRAERGYRAIRVDGPLPLDLVGIVAALASPLAAAAVPIFPIATYDTDYVLVRQADAATTMAIWRESGHEIAES